MQMRCAACVALVLLLGTQLARCDPYPAKPPSGQSTKPTLRLRVAVCMFGLTRSLKFTLSNIRSNLLDPLQAEGMHYDIFLHTYERKVIHNPRAYESNVAVDPYMYKLFQPKHAMVEPYSVVMKLRATVENYTKHGDAWQEDHHTSLGNLLAQMHSLKKVTEMWSDKAEDYDAFIYTRSDLWFFNHINISEIVAASKNLKPMVFLPRFGLWGGENDRFVLGNAGGVMVYAKRGDKALEYSQKVELHAERFLGWVMKSSGIEVQRSSILFARVRSTGMLHDAPVIKDGNVVGVDDPGGWKKLVRRPEGIWEFQDLDANKQRRLLFRGPS